MTTIQLPTEIEAPLIEEARRQGTTPELLAIETLRERFSSLPGTATPKESQTLFDFLKDSIGAVDGTSEPLSERCGERFADDLQERRGG